MTKIPSTAAFRQGKKLWFDCPVCGGTHEIKGDVTLPPFLTSCHKRPKNVFISRIIMRPTKDG